MPEIVRNVVKFTVIQKMRYKKVADKLKVFVYFGLLLVLTRQNAVTVRDRPIMQWRSNRKSGSPIPKIGSPPYFYFQFGL